MRAARRFAVPALMLCVVGLSPIYAQVTPGSKAAGLDRCVEPTDYMRKYHMDVLLHQRDRTVHQGIRTKPHSLVECVDCHAGKDAQGQFVSIDADGQFCRSCHDATAVNMDCFQCHATRPEDSVAGLRLPVQVAMTAPACVERNSP